MRSVRIWVALGLAGWLGLAGCAEQVPDPPRPSPPASSATTSPAVDPIDQAQQSLAYVEREGSGATGVVLSGDGQVLAHNPALAEAPEAPVTVTVAGNEREGTVLGGDPRTGLVVVTVEPAADLVPAVLGDSDLVEVGDEVTLLRGGPAGEVPPSPGVITATGALVEGTGAAMIEFEVADEPTGGGPVVNSAGEVIGIASAWAIGTDGEVARSFAIPSGVVAWIAEALVETGEVVYPYLGVAVEDAPGGGAVIEQVEPGGPADAAGLRTGDVIVQVGDRRVEVAADVVVAVQAWAVGDEVTVTYLRDGAEAEATATLVPAPTG